MSSPSSNNPNSPLSDAALDGFLRGSLPPQEMARVTEMLQQSAAARAQLEERRRAGGDSHHAETMADLGSHSNSGTHGPSAADAPPSPTGPRQPTAEPPASVRRTAEEFAALLSHSGLMSADDVHSFLEKSVPPDITISSADELAAQLVKKKKITPYQVEWLNQGKADGLVLGKYVVLEKLGAGGMGIVYKAQHRRMKRVVALKVLPEALTKSPDAVGRFHREVEAAAKLQHPNIAAAYDADEDRGVHFLVMEYIDGPNLSSYLKEHGALPLPYAVALTLQAAQGLSHAHRMGVVHRDIKPGNLMVDSSDHR